MKRRNCHPIADGGVEIQVIAAAVAGSLRLHFVQVHQVLQRIRLDQALLLVARAHLSQQHGQEFVVGDVLNLSRHDPPRLLINGLVTPVRIQIGQFSC